MSPDAITSQVFKEHVQHFNVPTYKFFSVLTIQNAQVPLAAESLRQAAGGGSGRTRTTDLTLIRGAL